METLYSYGNDQAVDDGIFADVTPESQKQKGWQWLVTRSVYEKFSLAAFGELYNELVLHFKKTGEVLTTGKMNGEKMMLMFEQDGEKRIFEICLPCEY